MQGSARSSVLTNTDRTFYRPLAIENGQRSVPHPRWGLTQRYHVQIHVVFGACPDERYALGLAPALSCSHWCSRWGLPWRAKSAGACPCAVMFTFV